MSCNCSGFYFQMNRSEFKDLDPEARIKIEGFRPGLYVRVELKIDSEFVRFFDPQCPVILGGILPKEDELGFVTVNMMLFSWCLCLNYNFL